MSTYSSFSHSTHEIHCFSYTAVNLRSTLTWLCSLIYAFGNLEYAQGNVTAAKKIYENGHKISYNLGPTHVLTATFNYKLGVVEARLNNYNEAM